MSMQRASRKSKIVRSFVVTSLALLLASSVLVLPVQAQIGPTSGQINTTIDSYQIEADVAIAADGTILVVWRSGPSSNRVIRGRLFDATGQPKGPDFEVDSGISPAVAAEPDGGFIVVWDGGITVEAQRLSAEGDLDGPQFVVHTAKGYYSYGVADPDVAVGPGGEMMVVWDRRESFGGPSSTTFFWVESRTYDAAGSPGMVELVDTQSCEDLFCGSVDLGGVTVGDNGEFVVAWEHYDWYLEVLRDEIATTRFATDGMPLGSDLLINADTAIQKESASVAHSDGTYLVVWDSNDAEDGSGRGIRGQLLDATGTPEGSELQINSTTAGDQVEASVSPYPAIQTAFLVVWEDEGVTPVAIRGQVIDGAGQKVGPEIELATTVVGDERRPASHLGTVVWESDGSLGDDDDSFSIQGRAVARPHLFADGFESGDTSAWMGTADKAP